MLFLHFFSQRVGKPNLFSLPTPRWKLFLEFHNLMLMFAPIRGAFEVREQVMSGIGTIVDFRGFVPDGRCHCKF